MLLGYVAVALVISGGGCGCSLLQSKKQTPTPEGGHRADRRGILRGPKVEFLSPGDTTQSPLHLKLKFEAFGGAKIDPESVKMTFLRTPNVDLTPRIKPFVQPSGLDMPDTEVPPGEYMVRVDVKDSDGRPGSTSFILKVAPSP
jgi:hypothetical protein